MYWSGEEYVLLATGVLFAAVVTASVHRRVTLTARSRLTFSVGAIVFLAAAVVLASIDSVVYPPFLWLAPLVPLVILGVLIRDAVVSARGETSAPSQRSSSAPVRRASVIPVAAVTPGSPSDRMLRMRAADPTASPQELARIAYAHPDMRATVAGNPSTPANLLEWLASVGDPAVHSAISTRTSAAL
ncbi:hypothetical protein [Demequina litorisediminis]|uniref:variant leucine-rich repeat-containing protein n=1 Tax=Demequina litorisediminis TaxID=1849022 RepID=UPI0024E12344|nr:hypothetical protein [Demequina litorisediminis]